MKARPLGLLLTLLVLLPAHANTPADALQRSFQLGKIRIGVGLDAQHGRLGLEASGQHQGRLDSLSTSLLGARDAGWTCGMRFRSQATSAWGLDGLWSSAEDANNSMEVHARLAWGGTLSRYPDGTRCYAPGELPTRSVATEPDAGITGGTPLPSVVTLPAAMPVDIFALMPFVDLR